MSEKETNGRQTFLVKKWLEDSELNIWPSEVKGIQQVAIVKYAELYPNDLQWVNQL